MQRLDDSMRPAAWVVEHERARAQQQPDHPTRGKHVRGRRSPADKPCAPTFISHLEEPTPYPRRERRANHTIGSVCDESREYERQCARTHTRESARVENVHGKRALYVEFPGESLWGLGHELALVYRAHDLCRSLDRYCYVRLHDSQLDELFRYANGRSWSPTAAELALYPRNTSVRFDGRLDTLFAQLEAEEVCRCSCLVARGVRCVRCGVYAAGAASARHRAARCDADARVRGWPAAASAAVGRVSSRGEPAPSSCGRCRSSTGASPRRRGTRTTPRGAARRQTRTSRAVSARSSHRRASAFLARPTPQPTICAPASRTHLTCSGRRTPPLDRASLPPARRRWNGVKLWPGFGVACACRRRRVKPRGGGRPHARARCRRGR